MSGYRRLTRLLLAAGLVAGLVGVAYVGRTGQDAEPVGGKMVAAALKFLDTLKEEQKGKATFAFDDKERTNWHFVPWQTPDKKPMRKGLALEDMTEEQKQAALGLLRAGTSSDGYTKATTIMSLESILRELEKGRGPARNPEWYFFTVFGKPGRSGKWGWRVEGHHLSLNFTLDGDKVIGSTPAFFGANPATVLEGKDKGLRTLPQAEDLAWALSSSLDKEQRDQALQKEQFGETPDASTAPKVGEPKGLPGAKMTDKQKSLLLKLLEAYTARMPADVGEAELKQAREAGVDKVYFAYAGGVEPGVPHTYRIQGPTLVVEFLNVQNDGAGNPANHIHSSWRDSRGDFGLATTP